jgi:hypothetical protein
MGVPELGRRQHTRLRLAVALTVVLSLLIGLLAGALGGNGHVLTIGFVGALALPFVFWRRPTSAVITLLVCATVIEQYPYVVGTTNLDAFTDKLPIFKSLSDGLGVSGLVMSPFDVALITIAVIWLMRGVAEGTLHLPHGRLAMAVKLMTLLALAALVHGLLTGGNATALREEIRPWLYFGLAFILGSQLLTTQRALRAVLWTLVLGSGFKAAQGVVILLQSRNLTPAPEAILAHEEAFFFGLFVVLTIGLWLFEIRGRLRTTATTLLPLVVLADLGNNRRTAWLILGAGIAILLVLVYAARPERRHLLRRIAAVGAVVALVYFPIFWNGSGIFAQPARAVRSMIAPDPRDLSSNVYRAAENANLGVMILGAGPLGTGFGIPIDYTKFPIVDVSGIDPLIAYIPHNGILWVWMRTGIGGELVLWLVVGSAILLGSRTSRSRDSETALLGALVACASAAWMIEGYDDLGFYWFRIAIMFGCLLGVLHAAVVRDGSLRLSEAPSRQRPVGLAREAA